MTPIELSTRRRVTGLTSDEFARLFVSLQREVDGEAAQWSATDVESWELVGPPVTAEQHLIDTFAAANEFVSTLADRLYRTIMPVTEDSVITAYSDDITFWVPIQISAVCRTRSGTSPHCRRRNGLARRLASFANWMYASRWCELWNSKSPREANVVFEHLLVLPIIEVTH